MDRPAKLSYQMKMIWSSSSALTFTPCQNHIEFGKRNHGLIHLGIRYTITWIPSSVFWTRLQPARYMYLAFSIYLNIVDRNVSV